MGEEVSTFLWGYGFEKPRDGGLDLIETPGVLVSREGVELGERLLDRVQVGTVRRQIEQLGTRRPDRSPYGRVLMAAEIVHHHDIAWPQSWNQELHHPGEETLGVDGAIQDARRGNPITSQPGHEGECLALAVRNLGDQALASGAAAMQAGLRDGRHEPLSRPSTRHGRPRPPLPLSLSRRAPAIVRRTAYPAVGLSRSAAVGGGHAAERTRRCALIQPYSLAVDQVSRRSVERLDS